jgi:hypothetical protein
LLSGRLADLIFDEIPYHWLHVDIIQTDLADPARENGKPHGRGEFLVNDDDSLGLQDTIPSLKVSFLVPEFDTKL